MATHQNKPIHVEAFKKTKVETTYEYVPILGDILGYWRKSFANRIGDSIELHIATSLSEYDVVTINGKEISTKSIINQVE